MNRPITYFKDSELDKYRTVCSLLAYYFKSWVGGRSPGRVIVLTSVEE